MSNENSLAWTPEAQARLMQVPEGIMRELTRQRVEELARRSGRTLVTPDLVETKYQQWSEGSAKTESTMAWTIEARGRVERIPLSVRGMVVKAIEAYAAKRGVQEITSDLVDEARHSWAGTGKFHEP